MLERLDIKCVEHLCRHLGCTEDGLWSFYQHPEAWYWRSEKKVKGKLRPIARPLGAFYPVSQRLQALLRRVVLPPYLHGGIKGHSPKTNAFVHIGKAAVLKFDLQDFFPRIRPGKVYKMFLERLGCSRIVARVLTRLVTLDGGLPQGSPTSTTVANLVIVPLAQRLNGLAMSHGSDYGQFVDDGAMSGPCYIDRLRSLIERIIRQEGFRASPKPHKRLTRYWYQEQVVTGVKVNRQIDAPSEKIQEVSGLLDTIESQVCAARRLSESQIRSVAGKIQNIRNLNPSLGTAFRKRLADLVANNGISSSAAREGRACARVPRIGGWKPIVRTVWAAHEN
jgi:hypothetical protein